MPMEEKEIPWWRKALSYALDGIRSGFGLFSRSAKDKEPEEHVIAGPEEQVAVAGQQENPKEEAELIEPSPAMKNSGEAPVEAGPAPLEETAIAPGLEPESALDATPDAEPEPALTAHHLPPEPESAREQEIDEAIESASVATVASAAEIVTPSGPATEEAPAEESEPVETADPAESPAEAQNASDFAEEVTEAYEATAISGELHPRAIEAGPVPEDKVTAEPVHEDPIESPPESPDDQEIPAQATSAMGEVASETVFAEPTEPIEPEATSATGAVAGEETTLTENKQSPSADLEDPAAVATDADADKKEPAPEPDLSSAESLAPSVESRDAAIHEFEQQMPKHSPAAEAESADEVALLAEPVPADESAAEPVPQPMKTIDPIPEQPEEPANENAAVDLPPPDSVKTAPASELAVEPEAAPGQPHEPAVVAVKPSEIEPVKEPVLPQEPPQKTPIKLESRDNEADLSPFSVIVAQVYDGPLDLLLDLIRKQDIDIYDIPIARITAQFLAYVNQLKATDVDVAGEFIYTASLLIHIKSRMLLPRAPSGPDDSAEDPRRELVERLLEHERFKNAAQMLQQKQMLEAATWTNPGIHEFRDDVAAEPEIAADTVDLVRIFRDILERARNRPVINVEEDSVTVGQMIQFLARRLTMEDKPVALRRLLSHTRSERALIAMFLALLELVRLQAILLRQDRAFSEIFIKKHTGFDSLMNDGLANARDDWQ